VALSTIARVVVYRIIPIEIRKPLKIPIPTTITAAIEYKYLPIIFNCGYFDSINYWHVILLSFFICARDVTTGK